MATIERQNDFAGNIETLADAAASYLKDLIALKTSDHGITNRGKIEALQFIAAAGVLGQCCQTGQYARAGDWLVASLNDDLAFGDEHATSDVRIGILGEMLAAPAGIIQVNAVLSISQWAAQAYLYMRRLRAFPEIGRSVFRYCAEAVERGMAAGDPESLEAALRMAEWAAALSDPNAAAFVGWLEQLYSVLPEPWSARIAATFVSQVGELTATPPNDWARRVLQDHWQSADPAMRLAAVVQISSTPAGYDEHRLLLTETVEPFLRPSESASVFDRAQFLESSFQAIHPVLNHLLRSGRTSEVMQLVNLWFGVRHGLADAVIVAPAFQDICTWSSQGRFQEVPHGRDKAWQRLIAAYNAALGATISGGSGYDATEEVDVRRLGIPNPLRGEDFEQACSDVFGLGAVDSGALLQPPNPMLLLTSLAIPLQAITLRSFNKIWPRSVTLREPLPDRKLSRIGVWFHPVLHGDWELDILRSVFGCAGMDIVVESSGGKDEVERFRALYQSHEFDVVWVIGHGDSPPYSPDQSALHVLERGAIRLQDPTEMQPPTSERSRLLVLNVCTVGSAVSYGGLGQASLGAIATNANQKTICHLWPITTVAAIAFGACLADALTRKDSALEAYESAMRYLSGATPKLIDKMRSIAGVSEDIVRRLEAQDDLGNIINSGSAALFV